jgi:hypothetical protein
MLKYIYIYIYIYIQYGAPSKVKQCSALSLSHREIEVLDSFKCFLSKVIYDIIYIYSNNNVIIIL